MHLLPYLAAIELHGADSVQFLHGQLSADIAGLDPGGATFACLCQPKGRAVALLLVQPLDDGARVVCGKALAPLVLQRLSMYVLRADVTLARRDDLYVCGLPEGDGESLQPLPGLAYRLASAPHPPPGDWMPWKAEEIRRGVVWLDPASREQFLPQMLGYEAIGALSFRKGCYPGQEIIARTRYLGSLKRLPLVVDTVTGAAPEVMESLEVLGDGWRVSAVVVDHARVGPGRTRWFLVIRSRQPFPATHLVWRAQTLAVATT